MTLLLALLACVPSGSDGPGPRRERPVDTDDPEVPKTSTASTGATGATGDTGATLPAPDACAELPVTPVTFEEVSLQTEEDFDFDPDGYLISQSFQNVVGTSRTGGFKIVATNVGADPAGLRVLPSGDIAVAQPDTGSLQRIDVATGSVVDVVGGLTTPNGLEVDTDGFVYVSERAVAGRVRRVDPYTGQQWLVADGLTYPNGLALSPDEQVLYVVTSSSMWGGEGRIYAVDRVDAVNWSAPRLFYEAFPGETFDGINTDSCGNVYVVEYASGRVMRITPDGAQLDPVANLMGGGWGEWPSLRWGNGVGGFERDQLYVTNRSNVFVLDMGIEGRAPVVAP